MWGGRLRGGRSADGRVQATLPAYLAKRALHATQEVSLLQPIVVAADVMDFKPETLNLFKVKVHRKQFGVHRVYAGTDHLRPVHLKEERENPQGLGFCYQPSGRLILWHIPVFQTINTLWRVLRAGKLKLCQLLQRMK